MDPRLTISFDEAVSTSKVRRNQAFQAVLLPTLFSAGTDRLLPIAVSGWKPAVNWATSSCMPGWDQLSFGDGLR